MKKFEGWTTVDWDVAQGDGSVSFQVIGPGNVQLYSKSGPSHHFQFFTPYSQHCTFRIQNLTGNEFIAKVSHD
jgi:hypothetical protein